LSAFLEIIHQLGKIYKFIDKIIDKRRSNFFSRGHMLDFTTFLSTRPFYICVLTVVAWSLGAGGAGVDL